MAQSLFKALKQQQPDVSIDVLAPGWSLPLLQRMPEVADAIDMPLGHGELKLAARRLLGKSLRGQGYRQAIVLPNSLKSALIPFWARIPRRTGYVGEMRYGLLNDARRLDKQQLPMTVQRFAALGQRKDATLPAAVQAPSLSVSDESVEHALSRLQLHKPGDKLLVLCPGAEFGEAKRWPARYYAEVAKQSHQQGWQVWLFGSEKDQLVTASINQLAGNCCTDLAGKTRLAEAIDLMSLADVVISNDSGLMHVAAALNKSLVAIYGSSDPGFTPPLNPEAKILRLGLDCSPCFKRECPLGHLNCLEGLKPDKVFMAMGIEPL
ncbi:MAG: lipopolysaccharide heptosyltransferase II [Gammaproteobacteria bacterium]|nr:MAG: lipopolysaccharide heptosyltransferase II [Gammaproteobacteria bacterium]